MVTRPPFEDVPVNRFYQYRLVSRSESAAEIVMPVSRSYLQEEGVVQGGIISSLADTTAVYVFLPDLPPGYKMTSIEFKMNFLRPAAADVGDLRAVATLVRRGRTIGVCTVDVWQSDRHIATGVFTYLFFQANE